MTCGSSGGGSVSRKGTSVQPILGTFSGAYELNIKGLSLAKCSAGLSKALHHHKHGGCAFLCHLSFPVLSPSYRSFIGPFLWMFSHFSPCITSEVLWHMGLSEGRLHPAPTLFISSALAPSFIHASLGGACAISLRCQLILSFVQTKLARYNKTHKFHAS